MSTKKGTTSLPVPLEPRRRSPATSHSDPKLGAAEALRRLMCLFIFSLVLSKVYTFFGNALSHRRRSAMSLLKSLFSLDTLDKRFTTPSRAPFVTKGDPDPVKATPRSELPDGASSSLWRTPEFFLYYVVFLIAIPQMFKAVYDISQRRCFLGPSCGFF